VGSEQSGNKLGRIPTMGNNPHSWDGNPLLCTLYPSGKAKEPDQYSGPCDQKNSFIVSDDKTYRDLSFKEVDMEEWFKKVGKMEIKNNVPEFPWAKHNIYTPIFSRQYNADPHIPKDDDDPPLPEAIKRAATTKQPLNASAWQKPGLLNYPKNFEVMDENLNHTRKSWEEEKAAKAEAKANAEKEAERVEKERKLKEKTEKAAKAEAKANAEKKKRREEEDALKKKKFSDEAIQKERLANLKKAQEDCKKDFPVYEKENGRIKKRKKKSGRGVEKIQKMEKVPFIINNHQSGIKLKPVTEKRPFYDKSGKIDTCFKTEDELKAAMDEYDQETEATAQATIRNLKRNADKADKKRKSEQLKQDDIGKWYDNEIKKTQALLKNAMSQTPVNSSAIRKISENIKKLQKDKKIEVNKKTAEEAARKKEEVKKKWESKSENVGTYEHYLEEKAKAKAAEEEERKKKKEIAEKQKVEHECPVDGHTDSPKDLITELSEKKTFKFMTVPQQTSIKKKLEKFYCFESDEDMNDWKTNLKDAFNKEDNTSIELWLIQKKFIKKKQENISPENKKLALYNKIIKDYFEDRLFYTQAKKQQKDEAAAEAAKKARRRDAEELKKKNKLEEAEKKCTSENEGTFIKRNELIVELANKLNIKTKTDRTELSTLLPGKISYCFNKKDYETWNKEFVKLYDQWGTKKSPKTLKNLTEFINSAKYIKTHEGGKRKKKTRRKKKKLKRKQTRRKK